MIIGDEKLCTEKLFNEWTSTRTGNNSTRLGEAYRAYKDIRFNILSDLEKIYWMPSISRTCLALDSFAAPLAARTVCPRNVLAARDAKFMSAYLSEFSILLLINVIKAID
jgi:hypothetical protein